MTANKHIPHSFAVQTLGCKVNQYETEVIIGSLQKKGWVLCPPEEAPALIIVNTCTVTGKAAAQARQMIRHIIGTHPDACIVVTGCYAQTGVDALKTIAGIHYIIGQSHKHQLPDEIHSAAHSGLSWKPRKPVVLTADIEKITTFACTENPLTRNRTRPVVKIQDGCSSFCTYCIVPYTRGPSRSLPVSRAIRQIKDLHGAGFLEIVLTGIHLGHYGKDLTPETSLYELVKTILATTAIPRIRLSSIEPNELSEDMILLAKSSRRICPHFHLPLQSGDNAVLKKMNRPYTREDFHDRVMQIQKHMSRCGLGVDVLVGFPGETDAAFENTYHLIAELPATYLHVFPFSPRKGTPAAKFSNPVTPRVIKERCARLRELGNTKKKAFFESLAGQTTTVLVEEQSTLEKGVLKGLSPHYVPVYIKGEKDLKNTLVTVTLKDVIFDPVKKIPIGCVGNL